MLPFQKHFPGLDSLRVYAALCVVISHLENQFDDRAGFAQVLAWFALDAQSAVNFFFCLSGFLITYLLLVEQKREGRIHVRAFYVRRALRILPLYFFILWLGVFLFPALFGANYLPQNLSIVHLLLAVLLLPNFAMLGVPLAHLWSIGLEQQFYLFWPHAARSTSVLLKVIFGILILKVFLVIVSTLVPTLGILPMLMGLRFECMALGGLAAWLYVEQSAALRRLYHKATFGAALAVCVGFAVFEIPFSFPAEVISSLAFVILILNVATNPRLRALPEPGLLQGFGKISYGIYMYHFPILFLLVLGADALRLQTNEWYPALLYASTLGFTLLVAALSYRWLEQPCVRVYRNRDASKPEQAPLVTS